MNVAVYQINGNSTSCVTACSTKNNENINVPYQFPVLRAATVTKSLQSYMFPAYELTAVPAIFLTNLLM